MLRLCSVVVSHIFWGGGFCKIAGCTVLGGRFGFRCHREANMLSSSGEGQQASKRVT